MRSYFKDYREIYYLTVGGFMAFFMALMRTGGFTRRHLTMRCSEAIMCSMLASAITISSNVWFAWPYELGTPIGAFVGFIGTDFIRIIIKGYVRSRTVKTKENQNDKPL